VRFGLGKEYRLSQVRIVSVGIPVACDKAPIDINLPPMNSTYPKLLHLQELSQEYILNKCSKPIQI
jgi:hypothetical protein